METIYKRCAIILAGLLTAGLAACSDSETQEPAPVAVTGVKLDRTEPLMLEIGDRTTLAAVILPANASNRNLLWQSDNEAIATVDEGLVTALTPGTATITVITEEGGHRATCEVTVNGRAEHPVFGKISFRTETTWEVGEQIWSDAVMVSAARGKTAYNGGDTNGYLVDFCENPGYGDLFSWEAVNLYRDALCPDGWQVPSKADFVARDIALGGTGENRWAESNVALIEGQWLNPDVWGGELGGRMEGVGNYLFAQTMWGHYWAMDIAPDGTDGNALSLSLSFDGEINPRQSAFKPNGFTLRCVKKK